MPSSVQFSESDLEKFAELIVLKCASLTEAQDVSPAFKLRMSWAVKNTLELIMTKQDLIDHITDYLANPELMEAEKVHRLLIDDIIDEHRQRMGGKKL